MNPCPGCGEENPVLRVVVPHKGWNAMSAVCCPRCYMQGPVAVGDEEAIRIWNAMPRACGGQRRYQFIKQKGE